MQALKVRDNVAVAERDVVEHVDEGGRGLVGHTPAAVKKGNLVSRDKALDRGLQRRRLLLEPQLKEALLDDVEAAVRAR